MLELEGTLSMTPQNKFPFSCMRKLRLRLSGVICLKSHSKQIGKMVWTQFSWLQVWSFLLAPILFCPLTVILPSMVIFLSLFSAVSPWAESYKSSCCIHSPESFSSWHRIYLRRQMSRYYCGWFALSCLSVLCTLKMLQSSEPSLELLTLTVRMRVWSLALLSVLRIQHCCKLPCRLQM